jgi:ABC-type transport system substrate-binding protein
MLPSADDPRLTFAFYRSDYSPPRFAYANDEFDALYEESMDLDYINETAEIIELCQQMEKIIAVDDLVNIPLYERPEKVVFSDRVKLPVDHFIVGWGFGEIYCELVD